ncbi:unnamed protein product [Fusarium fujikuroi]|nr:hypothetical protein CEK25_005333 [Fusarium fujikuroi]VZH91901.1 unnamed protein product [Fusarium fujikuroi]
MNSTARTAYVVQFLQHEVSKLHSRETCWHQSGVGGLLALLRANLSESKSWNSSFVSGGPYTFNATGNLFTVDLATKHFDVNTVDQDTFITLTYVHALCLIIAFFLVYPIILLMESM